jgi:hypothetical protein
MHPRQSKPSYGDTAEVLVSSTTMKYLKAAQHRRLAIQETGLTFFDSAIDIEKLPFQTDDSISVVDLPIVSISAAGDVQYEGQLKEFWKFADPIPQISFPITSDDYWTHYGCHLEIHGTGTDSLVKLFSCDAMSVRSALASYRQGLDFPEDKNQFGHKKRYAVLCSGLMIKGLVVCRYHTENFGKETSCQNSHRLFFKESHCWLGGKVVDFY